MPVDPLSAAAGAAALWALDKAAGVIVGEYAKRNWFDAAARLSEKNRAALDEIDRISKEYDELGVLARRLIENDRMLRGELRTLELR